MSLRDCLWPQLNPTTGEFMEGSEQILSGGDLFRGSGPNKPAQAPARPQEAKL